MEARRDNQCLYIKLEISKGGRFLAIVWRPQSRQPWLLPMFDPDKALVQD